MSWVEWMKGICLIWSRGRLISPSLPVGDDWYLNLNSQKRPPGRNLVEHRLVRRSGATSRATVVLVLSLRMRSLPRTEVPIIFMRRSICVGSTKNLTPMTKFTRATWLQNVYLTVVWSLELEITLITALPKAVLSNPLLLLLLQHQAYPSCEKESRLNTHNLLITSGYSVSIEASFPWISPLLSLLPLTTSLLRLGVEVLLVGLRTLKHGASLPHPASCLLFPGGPQ